MTKKNLFTLSETSRILGLSLSTLRRWSASGRLPTVKFSKRTVRVSRNEIKNLIQNGLPKPPIQQEDK